jgi:hypothetical protein
MYNHGSSVAVPHPVTSRWLVATAATLALFAFLLIVPASGHAAPAAGPVVSTRRRASGER